MFLLIDKPKGVTSHDVINSVRKITGVKRVGHAGTLDPNASGLLIVGVGRESTKLLWTKFAALKKTYLAEIHLGEERDTDDIEGKVIPSSSDSVNNISLVKLKKSLSKFIGEQLQTPPFYSAIKIKGKNAYKSARSGNYIELKPRKVNVYSLILKDYKFPLLKIEVRVSSGTYIRSLARDIGRDLGCGAFLVNLRRTDIGKYSVDDAAKIKDLWDKINDINIKWRIDV